MVNKPNLRLKSDENGRPLWIMGNSTKIERGNVLKFEVENIGEAIAHQSPKKPTRIQLSYGTYITHEFLIKMDIDVSCDHPIEFDLPEPKFYDPDCEFEITIDTKKNLDESNRDNNFASGVLTKDEELYRYLTEPSYRRMSGGDKVLVYVKVEDKDLPNEWAPSLVFKLDEEPRSGEIKDKAGDALGFEVPLEFINKPYTIEVKLDPTQRRDSAGIHKSGSKAKC